MNTLLTLSRECVNQISGLDGQGEFTNFWHLNWMIDQVEKNTNWPPDKRVRWLGFVLGTTDRLLNGIDGKCGDRMVSLHTPFLARMNCNYKHEQIIMNACDEVLSFLEAAADELVIKPSFIQEMISVARRSVTANKTSFCLGFCQAYLSALDIIDVNEERDRTRPIFHAAYEACGYNKPATLQRESA